MTESKSRLQTINDSLGKHRRLLSGLLVICVLVLTVILFPGWFAMAYIVILDLFSGGGEFP